MKQIKGHSHHWSEDFTGPKKLIISVVITLLSYSLLSLAEIETKSRIILGWDVFCILMLAFSWILFTRTNSSDLCVVVEKQDDGIKVIFLIVTIGIFFGVFGAIALILEGTVASTN